MEWTKSQKAFEKAQELIPGGVDSPVRAFKQVGGTPPFIAKGKGSYLYDIDGNCYVDYVQSWGPLLFGHADPETLDAVINAAHLGLSFGAPTELETQLAEAVLAVYGSPTIQKIRFVSSGTEAVMSAIRLARGVTGKNGIVKFEGCYHGHSDSLLVKAGSGATTFGNPSSPGVPADLTQHTHLAKYNNSESVRACFRDSSDIACVIIEPIAGNMGLVPATNAFLEELKEICVANGALLIFDEVMSGFRASKQGSLGYTSVQPDIVTFGKVIGGGMPVGAFGASREIMANLSPEGAVYQAGTLSGNPVAMNAGLVMMKKINDDETLYLRLEALATRLMEGFSTKAKEAGITLQTDVRGSMFGFFFNDNPVMNYDDALTSDLKRFGAFHRAMLCEGYYFACSQFEAGFICSTMDEATIDATVEAAGRVFSTL